MSNRQHQYSAVNDAFRRINIISKFQLKKQQKEKKDISPAIDLSTLSETSHKDRVIKAALKRQNRLKAPETREELKQTIFDDNIEFKVSIDSSFKFFGNIITWFFTPLNIAVTLFSVLGYIYKSVVNPWNSIIIQTTFAICVFATLFLIAFLNTLKEMYNIFNDDKNDTQRWLSEEDIIKLYKQMPWYLSQPEVETATWFNELLRKLWKLIDIYQTTEIEKSLDPNGLITDLGIANDYLGFRKVQFTLGKNSPTISGVHVLKRGVKRNEIIMDMEIIYDGDMNILFSGFYKVNAGIDKFYLRAFVRIIIGPLIRENPTVASLLVTFFKPPIIEWRFTGILRLLNANCLQSFVSQCIYCIYGNPNKFDMKIAKFIPYKEVKLFEPLGVFRIDIIEAVGLPRSDVQFCFRNGKADAYCVVSYENEEKITQVIADSDNPEWNRNFIFLFRGSYDSFINFYVFDEDIEADDLLGVFRASINLFQQEEKGFNGRLFSAPLRDPETNKYMRNGKTQLRFRINYFHLSSDIANLKLSASLARKNLPVAVLSVLIDYATGLETTAKQVKTPELRSLVRVSVGNQQQVTSVKERTGYPVWEEVVNFFLFNPHLEDLHIEVVDIYYVMEKKYIPLSALATFNETGKKDDHIDWVTLSHQGTVVGYVNLPIVNIVNSKEKKSENIYQLEGYVEDGHIKISTTMRFTIYSQDVIDNQIKPRIAFPEEDKEVNIEEEENKGLMREQRK